MIFIRLFGLICMMGGGFWTLAALGLATMFDPTHLGGTWWAGYWQNLVSGGGLGMIVLGLTAILLGGWLVVVRFDSPIETKYDDRFQPLLPLKPFVLRGKRDG